MIFNKQKRYFNKKAVGVQNMIWDLEFKREKTRMIREDIRIEYDNLRSKLNVLDTQLNPEGKQELKEDELKVITDQKTLIETDISRFLGQMKGLDLEIEGSQVTPEYPDGVQGINHQLDALRELVGMLKEYSRTL